jgi:hypothetical protein
MKDVAKVVLTLVGVLALTMGLAWVIQGNSFFMYKVFAPKEEQVRREVFEQSKAYNQAMAQELDAMRFQYLQADEAHKAALGSIILHRVADYDLDRLPSDLADFIRQLRRERGAR